MNRAAVWIDHHEAKISHVDAESSAEFTLEAPRRTVRRHPVVTAERSHPADAEHFYHDVASALSDADEVLVFEPASAKLELVKHIQRHNRALAPKIVGVETIDHPTDGQLIAHVRKYFHFSDRLA